MPEGYALRLDDCCEVIPACEWCAKHSGQLTPIRDWEEHGSFAPKVYDVCPLCVEKHRQSFEAASAEWAAYMEPRYTATQ